MLKTFLNSARALAAATSLACVAMVGSVGFAGAGTGDIPVDGNTAVTFDPSTPTNVVVRFTDPKIGTGGFFQFGFTTNSANLFDIGTVEYSLNSTTGFDGDWVTYSTPPFGTVGAAPAVNYGDVPLTYTPAGNNFFFRYTLPAKTMTDGPDYSSVTQATLLVNSDGAVDGDGNLTTVIGNGFGALNRDHTAIGAPVVPEPTTFAIASIGLGMAGAARLRKRLAAKKA